MRCERCGSRLSEVYEYRGANLCFSCYADVLKSEHNRKFKGIHNAPVLRGGMPIGVVKGYESTCIEVYFWDRCIELERDLNGNVVAVELIK